jgi:hypothetical protein
MARNRHSTLLSRSHVELVRELLIDLRGHIDRSEIARQADVEIDDLDNFTTKRGRAETYKTRVPRNEFLHRIIAHLLELNRLTPDLFSEDSRADLVKLGQGYLAHLLKIDHADIMFNLLTALKAVTAQRCRDICDALEGAYYGYRYSAIDPKVFRSFFQIRKFRTYSKVPEFKNMFKEGDAVRVSTGSVIELGGVYIMVGLSVADTGAEHSPFGIKLVVLRHDGMFKKPKHLSGFYVSCNNDGSYNVGTMRFVRTVDKYDEANIGEVDGKLPFPGELISMNMPLATLAANDEELPPAEQLERLRAFVKTAALHRSALYFGPNNLRK